MQQCNLDGTPICSDMHAKHVYAQGQQTIDNTYAQGTIINATIKNTKYKQCKACTKNNQFKQ